MSPSDLTSKDVTLAILATKIDTLTQEMRATFAEMRFTTQAHDVTLYGEKSTIGLVGEVIVLKKELGQLKAIFGWIAVTFGGLVIGLLWAIFTGRAQILFP